MFPAIFNGLEFLQSVQVEVACKNTTEFRRGKMQIPIRSSA